MGKTKPKQAKINRSAETGQFVKEPYAKSHPSTTVQETVKKRGGKK